jgi:hypothetical protein
MKDWLGRFGRLVGVGGAQAVPVGGVFAAGWSPVTAIALYWFESLLLVVATAVLTALLRRTAELAPVDTPDDVADRDRRLRDIDRANIRTRDIVAFYGGSMLLFGVFVAMVTFVITQGAVFEELDVAQLQRGALAMTAFIGVGLAADAFRITSLPVATVQARVDSNMGRWAFFWILGFCGVLGAMLFGTPRTFFSFFVGLKAFWELGTLFDRAIGCTPVLPQAPRSGGLPLP